MNETNHRDLRARAINGEADAQFELGQCYERGLGETLSYSEAMLWYLKAAESGLAKAEYSIGLLYEHGRGDDQDYLQARNWYQKAAEKGDP